jgi:hypothetical protein
LVPGWNASGDNFQGQRFQVKESLEPPGDFQGDRRADEQELHLGSALVVAANCHLNQRYWD